MFNKFFQNTRKPKGVLGKFMIASMNSGHASLAKWGMEFINPAAQAQSLDIGCGGGANIATLLLKCPDGKVNGIDYSPVSVEAASKKNQAAIASGRCTITAGSVSELPFDENTFDLVTAFETVYFWPNLQNDFIQVFKVLKHGGCFTLCNESDGTDAAGEKWESIIDGMKIYRADELTGFLKNAGFDNIDVHSNTQKHWLCITALKK